MLVFPHSLVPWWDLCGCVVFLFWVLVLLINCAYSQHFHFTLFLHLKLYYFLSTSSIFNVWFQCMLISMYVDFNVCWFQCMFSAYSLLLLLSFFSRVRLCATPEMAAHQAPLFLGFSRQEHWSGLPFPSPMRESEKWKWSRSVMSDS